MDLEYDQKFEEMKKYIPFLESMIKRLESTNNGAKNPRKAQLDKIRSLRDLLLDKKKRMKMENLLKCEQVLVNLYAKVEQRDSMTDTKEECNEKIQQNKSDLNIVRNKLKSVVSKLQDDDPETLPEIARATNKEVVCTPGSKQPALFQRRPNKASPPRQSPSNQNDTSPNSKRQYTRVLMSPEHKKKEWLTDSDINTEKPLFSRRSPRRSPRRYSPSYKKERKKSSKQRSKSSPRSKDLNITLKVPEESLGSLNTKDILSRIINCSDNDVDIGTLRGLRSQILGELKQTGTKDDISDLILKSYKKKEKQSKKNDEVEEGELSDSESEAIENIYGSLVVVNPGESNSNTGKITSDKIEPRKIQICLVINSEKEKDSKINDQIRNTAVEITDFEVCTESQTTEDLSRKQENRIEKILSTEKIKSPVKITEEANKPSKKDTAHTESDKKSTDSKIKKNSQESQEKPKTSHESFKANFYQPFTEDKTKTEELHVKKNASSSTDKDIDNKRDIDANKPVSIMKNSETSGSSSKIKKKYNHVVSELEILQALKKEILGEATSDPVSEVITPPLHQPKITKVASAQEIVSKKRISIEKYKQKSIPSIKEPLFNSVKELSSFKDDSSKKQSLKLTEKECERFNFPDNVSPVESSEDEDKSSSDFEFLSGHCMNSEFHRDNSAPKSPDHEDFADTGIKPPVIIPSDPIKNVIVNAQADIDMRTLMPLLSPLPFGGTRKNITSPSLTSDKMPKTTWNEKGSSKEKIRKSIPDIRMRSESNLHTANNSPNSYLAETDRLPRPNTSYPNAPPNMSPNISSNIPPLMSLNVGALMAPSHNSNIVTSMNQIMVPNLNSNIPLMLNPNMTPNINPSMTPGRLMPSMNPMMTPILTPNARSYEMTPRPNFDNDDYTAQKHVYAPIFPTFEPHDFLEKDIIQINQSSVNRNDRYIGDKRLDSPQIRMECPSTPNPSFGRMDCPATPNPSFGRMECPSTPNPSFGRMECPSTPNPSFGRMECPSTPNPSFGRMDCPLTPNPSFGRMDCPSTPNPSFGRIETPMTPVHTFGRSDHSVTPSHSFSRSDPNMTPINVFGRGDYHHNTSSFKNKFVKSQDPRLNRCSDYDKYQRRHEETNRSYFEDDNMFDSTNTSRRSQVKSYEQNNRNSRNRMSRRESSVGPSLPRPYETDEFSNKNYYNNDYQYQGEKYKSSEDVNRRNYRARSMTRMNPSEEVFSAHRDRGVSKSYTRESSLEKPISVQSHTGRSFNIDTSFNRTFQDTKSSSASTSFDVRRQRASSVGRSLRECSNEDLKRTPTNQNKCMSDVTDRKNMQFRRACSVGRDLKDYNANKNFKDIKEDLRSCKFNNYYFDHEKNSNKSKSRLNYNNERVNSDKYKDSPGSNKFHLKSSDQQNNRDPRRRTRDCDSSTNKIAGRHKYSPKKNFRDPRMRRETDEKNTRDKYKDKDRSLSSSRYKNYGIVYSNDNIAKGTILASAAGVKNFKIPKIKRLIEENQVEINNQTEVDAKKEASLNIANKDVIINTDKSLKSESKSTKSKPEKSWDIENKNENIGVKPEKPKIKVDITSSNKTAVKSKNEDVYKEPVSLLADNCERRITRSAVKSGMQTKYQSPNKDTSPVKKLKRIKKPLVFDSDSDTQDYEKEKKNFIVHETVQLATDMKNNNYANVEEEGDIENYSNIKQTDDAEHLKLINCMIDNDIAVKSINVSINNIVTSDNIIQNSVPVITNESGDQNDSLDASFGADDELFSDNIAPGSVLDNINALIADLDQDIEAPKINDFNEKFINNIVGQTSSNNSLNSLNGNQIDFASDVTLHDKTGFVVGVPNAAKGQTDQITLNRNNTDEIGITRSKTKCGNFTAQHKEVSNVPNKTKKIKDNVAITMSFSDSDKSVQETNIEIKINIEKDNKSLNTDAVVSTTAYDEKTDEMSNANIVPSTCSFVPDSTNKFNENINDKDLLQSFPDSTNELSSEMNITSTNTDVTKEQSGATSTCDNLPRIDSIGKLLSILEDKNKIKELLTLLGTESGENEKIKKKLEKLSEIVSDDEETFKESSNRQEKQVIEIETHEKESNITVETSHQSDAKKESIFDNSKYDKEMNTEKSVFESTVQSSNVLQSDNESIMKDDNNKIYDNDQCGHIKDQNLADVDINIQVKNIVISNDNTFKNNIEIDGINNDIVDKAKANKQIDKKLKTNELSKDLIIANDAIQKDFEQVSETNVQENQIQDEVSAQLKCSKILVKKSKITKRGRSRLAKKLPLNKGKRVTRSEAGGSQPRIPPVPKKPSRELLKLQEDIRDMFISQDILNATGIRMCRLAKLVDDKHSKVDALTSEVEPEPIVVLENIKSKICPEEPFNSTEKNSKNKLVKLKENSYSEISIESKSKEKHKYKPGPKSKTKRQDDPYIFEVESIGESNNSIDNKDQNIHSDSDSMSTKSFGSSELLVELKKKTKRKRRRWQLGLIRKKGVKNKSSVKYTEVSSVAAEDAYHEKKDKSSQKIPDLNCFTDKSYCFYKNVKNYTCRLCKYHGNEIVLHYKKRHPHSEIPLSRLSPAIAKEAIAQCETMNLQAISKIQTMTYVCRFCFQEFHKQNTALETFFWHVVSVHTGEYKHLCSQCTNSTRCPFHLDIPPPPKNLKGQLIGYICGRCNFTQVSLENLKTHVIIRHDDEQTEVYSINLGEISEKVLQSLVSKGFESPAKGIRVLRSTRSNQSLTEPRNDHSDVTHTTDRIVNSDIARDNCIQEISANVPSNIAPKNKIQSKFNFENDDMSDTSNYSKNDEIVKASIKMERDDTPDNVSDETIESAPEQDIQQQPIDNVEDTDMQKELPPSNDVLIYPHFKIKLSETGAKEYICCINGLDNHYKTTLLISFKKHVQLKHVENWDGYCFVCKVIVTGQGKHKFKDCLQHFLDKHIDNFPVLDDAPESNSKDVTESETSSSINDVPISKSYINVRPLSELISSEQRETQDVTPSMPKIQRVVSLGAPDNPVNSERQKEEKVCSYEAAQAEIISKKHRVVLETMMTPEKLIQVFKCAGRFCSYTTDNAEEALLHASTHQRIGGESSLKCSYCDFDTAGNAIDLVMHVFKKYNHCSYTCSKCFYRAAASQLVYAHIKRVHADLDANKVPILSSATTVKDNTKDDMMSRDAAVLYYNCNNRDPEEGGTCQFKSYVLTKFREHLQTRHINDQEYSCYMCNTSAPSAKLLTQHLKTHGLRIYQCCRCLFGADNEPELIAHASEKHPLKQPKAYLRIITSKGGTSEVRVLPLAVLSKSTVETTVVIPSTDKENPVKQAERSLDLEKLIGQTNLMIESMCTITNAATIEPVDISANEDQIQLENEQASCSPSQMDSENTLPAVLTLLTDPQDTSKKFSADVKSEPETVYRESKNKNSKFVAATPASSDSDVVCLDSDDDNSRQNIIDLSGEDIATESNSGNKQEEAKEIKIPRSHLYKCSKCSCLSKSEGMFKRHLISCFPNPNELIKCAYCFWSSTPNSIVIHYNNIHLENTVPYICAICNGKFVSLAVAKKHMKLIHNETSTTVKSKTLSTGVLQHVIKSDVKERPVVKRKLSGDTGSKSSEPPHKLKRYGPQDVDKLPINPILDDLVYCSLCEFSTKVRLNMARHLQLHAEQQPAPRTAPVNPVPHLESNEKHFDKMVNLASSSVTTGNKTTKDGNVLLLEHLSPEAAAIYPKYVTEKHRYTCGAKDCSYISVNETMFKIHWETLHAGTNDYHCVHCPPHQNLDTSKPLTAVRIIAHLKMHDSKLYACSSCTFYHHTRKLIEKHVKEVHNGKLIIVREDGVPLPAAPPASVQSSNAPTMDLKPWQCGLCKFKSMLRPEVIEHCGKFHQSKMQFKCMYCGFRTSNIENISKHQLKQHPGKKEEVFYFYYREGSIPDDADGVARWQKQSQKSETQIKTEADTCSSDLVPILPKSVPPKPHYNVNLQIVKTEIVEPETNVQTEESVEELCKVFGQFCDPNGLRYKCSLCKVVIEDTKEAMQSHLYEELQYRKWGCAVCSYKAFHKPGLQQHVQTEHRHSGEAREPIELQVDSRIETWVTKQLEHQTLIIEKNKENLAKQKVEILRASPGSAAKVAEKPAEPPSVPSKCSMSMAELEKLFGPFGVPTNMNYTCPKCNISARTEAVMQEHLESELNKIRWCCSTCSETFQTYHEAQLHCRSVHYGQSSRPVEAVRDVALRAAWVSAVLRVQKLSMNIMPLTEAHAAVDTSAQPADSAAEDSLLVVRYEENVPTPEEQMKLNTKADTDDEKLPSEENETKKNPEIFVCKHCCATYKYATYYHNHLLKHYGLKPYTCPYCQLTENRKMIEAHIIKEHPNKSVVCLNTPLPDKDTVPSLIVPSSVVSDSDNTLICLSCEEAMTRAQCQTHYHNNVKPQFGIKGSVVYRCWHCMTLHKSCYDFNLHHKQAHAGEKKNSTFYKLDDENRTLLCSQCSQTFGNMAHYRAHQQIKHGLMSYGSNQPSDSTEVIDIDNEADVGEKRKADDDKIFPAPKRVAKKSTTKLPKVLAVAKKSTTKLPFDVPCDVRAEYSYYGTKPSMDNLENVTTLMPFYNTFVPFTLEKLSGIIKIFPIVVVKDINGKKSDNYNV